ncbi:MAG: hypothetical protein D6722_03100 [Bacteroidetes bacterium]|nr:MAG: hypothetical protein D6722_03100 [Bacteroidota bacterium]
MKLGVILECPKGGVDEKVYSYVFEQLCPELEVVVEEAGANKQQMIESCGPVAEILLDQGCEAVLIIWDLMPRWGGEPCRKEDVEAILEKMGEC